MGHSLRSTSAVTLVVFLALVVSSSAARVISDKRQSLFQLARGKFSATLGLAPSSSSDDGGGAPKPAPPPWFCHGIDCPQFRTVATTEVYETRAYPAGLIWTSTTVTGLEYDKAVSKGFMRLFHYISGGNVDKAKVPMTAPVRVRVMPGAGPFCESNFTISFFVPFVPGQPGVQIDPPAPTDPEVFTETDPSAFTAYVRSFSGYANEATLISNAATLVSALEADGKGSAKDRDHFFFAGYDAPFSPLHRHNEVWYTHAEGEVVAPAAA